MVNTTTHKIFHARLGIASPANRDSMYHQRQPAQGRSSEYKPHRSHAPFPALGMTQRRRLVFALFSGIAAVTLTSSLQAQRSAAETSLATVYGPAADSLID